MGFELSSRIRFCTRVPSRWKGGFALVRFLILALLAWPAAAEDGADNPRPAFWQVVHMTGKDVPCLLGRRADRVGVLACRERCAAIPWQFDERDGAGRLVLENGPHPNFDYPSGKIDANDEFLWMLDDAGRRMRPSELPAGVECGHAIRLRQGQFNAWVYALAFVGKASRSAKRYVHYNAERDLMRGARASFGFDGPMPHYLAARAPQGEPQHNLLDRLKVRASARFLGLLPLGRDEDDIEAVFVAWRAGPIRVIRRQRQWVRLGWGLRTPIFWAETYFYRDFVELPVHLRLNFPPTFFFRGIEVQAALDFRDLQGWRLLAADLAAPVTVGSTDKAGRERLNQLPGDWLALLGPDVTLVMTLQMGPTLATLDRELIYRENTAGEGPEAVRGEMPAVGYRLTSWGEVDSGRHWFSATSYALPPNYDLGWFLQRRQEPIQVESQPLTP